MTDIPIIFSAPMVRALLDGRKSMTRRILNPQPVAYQNEYCTRLRFSNPKGQEIGDASPNLLANGSCPAASFTRYAAGDRLWVREGWKPHSLYAGMKPRDMPKSKVFYLADDGYEPSNVKGLPSIHMPRWASRMTLPVDAVKVEQLQDLSEEDAIAEGVERNINGNYGVRGRLGGWLGNTFATAREAFSYLWMSLHGADSWEANPWVVAPSFRVIKANIDAAEARAA